MLNKMKTTTLTTLAALTLVAGLSTQANAATVTQPSTQISQLSLTQGFQNQLSDRAVVTKTAAVRGRSNYTAAVRSRTNYNGGHTLSNSRGVNKRQGVASRRNLSVPSKFKKGFGQPKVGHSGFNKNRLIKKSLFSN